jgi:hypothetical protein
MIQNNLDRVTYVPMWAIKNSVKCESTPIFFKTAHFYDKYGNTSIVSGQIQDKNTLNGLGRKIYLVPDKDRG